MKTRTRVTIFMAAVIIILSAIFALLVLSVKKNEETCIPFSAIDTNNDSLINSKEVLNAISLYNQGRISKEKVTMAVNAWISDANVTQTLLC